MRLIEKCIAVATICAAVSVFAAKTHAQDQVWTWYYITPEAQVEKPGVFLRFGGAVVIMKRQAVSVVFAEEKFPELQATFKGIRNKDGSVKGTLDGLFFSGPEMFVGRYTEKQIEQDCLLQELSLRSGIPDGSMLMIARAKGPCAVTE